MDDLDRLQGRYPENFVFMSQLEVCQEGGYLKDIEAWGFLTGDMEDMVIPDIMNDVFYPNEDILKIKSVSRRGGQEERYLEDVEGSWQETWRTWSFLTSWIMLP